MSSKYGMRLLSSSWSSSCSRHASGEALFQQFMKFLRNRLGDAVIKLSEGRMKKIIQASTDVHAKLSAREQDRCEDVTKLLGDYRATQTSPCSADSQRPQLGKISGILMESQKTTVG
jgi:hypothetical protein